jgi:hypothetical protein
MGSIWYENLFTALNKKKHLVDFLLQAIRYIIHSVRPDHNPEPKVCSHGGVTRIASNMA